MPAVIIAENVRGLRPYLPVLRLEYERHGYTAHIEMFNSKYWNVPQNRDRYAVVGTRNKKNLSFTFPKEQHEFVPKLSDYLEKDVPEKYYLPDEKAQTIIAQAMEKSTAESILAAAEAEAKTAAGREETTKTAIPAEETITPNSLANGMLQFLLDSGIVASACVTDETEKMFAKHIKEELDGITIGETPEILRDWEAAQNAVNDMLSKYAPGGYMGKIIYPLLTPLKERLEAGERTPDLYNAIVEATR